MQGVKYHNSVSFVFKKISRNGDQEVKSRIKEGMQLKEKAGKELVSKVGVKLI